MPSTRCRRAARSRSARRARAAGGGSAPRGGGGCGVGGAGAGGDRVWIRAADGGCGMSEETRRRVFEPFFTTKGAQGNGLGLAVVWGVGGRPGGQGHVRSAAGPVAGGGVRV